MSTGVTRYIYQKALLLKMLYIRLSFQLIKEGFQVIVDGYDLMFRLKILGNQELYQGTRNDIKKLILLF